MNKPLIKFLLTLFALAAVLSPILIWGQTATLTPDSTLLPTIFPVFGLIAFMIMWLHIIGGAFETWLNKYIDFGYFINWSSSVVLLLIILHPLIFILNFGFPKIAGIFSFGPGSFIWLGVLGWLMLITYDIRKAFKNRQFFIRHWGVIQFLSTLGFYVIFFHSLFLGHNIQAGPLRVAWIFFGITAAIATIYDYFLRPKLNSPD